ncbi:hypothetical protein [Modestobacter versicolor]|uniref:Uncharacterized protein n=1 Tax=Modestobacter versicolor TaxID=429133 RepID=A0A323VC12_9ACTN|nr:hypothetical protein [Modestobacter versicolor]MBB3677137.1 hypothetical protein [Modestobacter versicolor]PZA21583.1 hypothetical protein DMO24_09565 [Modestobacter versicolor]
MVEQVGDARQPQEPLWVTTVLVLLTAGWLLGTPVLALGTALDTWHLYGEPPAPAEYATAQRHAVLTTAVAAGLPGLAWWLAVRSQRSVAPTVYALAAVLGLVGGLVLYGMVSPDAPDAPVRDDGPRVCQEHSGGDATCPGG